MRRLLLLTLALVLFTTGAGFLAVHAAPVTDEMLANPDPADWLMTRRDYAATSHSPLNQITRDNVKDLQLAWAIGMEPGPYEGGPIVHDGIMYLYNSQDVVQALDAATGDLIWEYRYDVPQGLESQARLRGGLILYEDTVILHAVDATIVALNAHDGSVVYETTTIDTARTSIRHTSTGIVADGVIITGYTGCERFFDDSCFVTGHDARTGEELWRTYTVAQPGEHGGDTWADLPVLFRGGADAWTTASYDPELGLVFIAASQAKPWNHHARGTEDAELLYTNTQLALDPHTGEIVWYYQYIPGESYDLDEAFELVLADIDGEKYGFMMGKHAVLWQLNRETGELVRASDMGLQNVANFDPELGFVGYDEEKWNTPLGDMVFQCPSAAGFKSFRTMAFNPDLGAFFVPMNIQCAFTSYRDVDFVEGGGGHGSGGREQTFHPDYPDTVGKVLAVDVNGEELWSIDQYAIISSSILSTGGDLVFYGDIDRGLYAVDAETGEKLWQTRLTTRVGNSIASYAVDGKQYIAVPTYGTGGASWDNLVPQAMTPDIVWPKSGNALFVFALPEN